jgi:predicted nucleic acid-binding protein
MKPLVIDTSIWIEFLRGHQKDLREKIRHRMLLMPATVAMELLAGGRTREADSAVRALLDPFRRNRRVLVPSEEDHSKAGDVLARLQLGASRHGHDVMIAVLARRFGCELWSLNVADFSEPCRVLGLELGPK